MAIIFILSPNKSKGGRFQFSSFLLLASIALNWKIQTAICWVSTSTKRPSSGFPILQSKPLNSDPNDITDAEFTRSQEANSFDLRTDENLSNVPDKINDINLISSKSLFDISLDSDPDWKDIRIPFVETRRSGSNSGKDSSYSYIDVKLAFVAELDGVKYGIAIPFDSVVAITVENLDTGAVQYLSPDNDDNQELMEIMAVQLNESFGADLQLQRTPRVLTISGPLEEKYLKKWKDNVLPQPIETNDLLSNKDEDMDFFHEFMKKELGEEEYMQAINGDSIEEESEELLRLFSIVSNDENPNDDSIEKLLQTVMENPNDDVTFQTEMEKLLASKTIENSSNSLLHDGVALKLVSYILPPSSSENLGGKSYSLVKLLKPYALVAKYIPILSSDGEDNIRFELMNDTQEKVVIPKLEEIFWQELSESGLTFQANQSI